MMVSPCVICGMRHPFSSAYCSLPCQAVAWNSADHSTEILPLASPLYRRTTKLVRVVNKMEGRADG